MAPRPGSADRQLELFLFTESAKLAGLAERAGVDGVVVDWERQDKGARQRGYDTAISVAGRAELRAVREATRIRVICRVDLAQAGGADGQIEAAISLGADEVLLPMVRTPAEVERALAQTAGDCDLGILVETPEAVAVAAELAQLPLSRVYVGLNDLAIGRRIPNIFMSIDDGTVEDVRHRFRAPFGFAGLTLPDLGTPIPCRLLLAEMARLGADFSFLRRSFLRDVAPSQFGKAVTSIRKAFACALTRDAEAIEQDWLALRNAVLAADEYFAAVAALEAVET